MKSIVNKPETISVVVSTYNRADVLSDCITSLLKQTNVRIEIVVVVGPCTDNTNEILSQYENEIVVKHCSMRNLSMSRNIGLVHASGDVIAFIDDDAVAFENWASSILGAFQDENVVAAGGFTLNHNGAEYQAASTFCNVYGDSLQRNSLEKLDGIPEDEAINWFPSLLGTNCAFRASKLLAIGGFDENFHYFLDETDVCRRIARFGGKVVAVPNAIVLHRYAPSHLRNKHRVPTSLFEPAKSKAYFMRKHAILKNQRKDVYSNLNKYIDEIFRANHWLFENQYISIQKKNRLDDELLSGIQHGLELEVTVEKDLDRTCNQNFISSEFKSIALICREFPPNSFGGISKHYRELAVGFTNIGHSVHVYTLGKRRTVTFDSEGFWIHTIDPSVETERYKDLISSISLPFDQSAWSFVAAYEILASEIKFECVIAPIWDAQSTWISILSDLAIIVTLHTTAHHALTYKEDWKRLKFRHIHASRLIEWEKFCIERANILIANSELVARDIRPDSHEEGLDFDSKLSVIPHSISIGMDKGQIYCERDRQHINLLFVGSREFRKGFDLYCGFVMENALTLEHVNFRFITSNANDRHCENEYLKLKAFSKDNGLPERIEFLSNLSEDEMSESFSWASVCVVPSRFESFSLVALEALFRGCLVAISDSSGIAEFLTNNQRTLMLKENRLEVLTETIREKEGFWRFFDSKSGVSSLNDLDDFSNESVFGKWSNVLDQINV
jgi:glycosyltransferase involved in cell wall biosynthesis